MEVPKLGIQMNLLLFSSSMIYILKTKELDKNHLEKLGSFRKETTIMWIVTVIITVHVFEIKSYKSEPKCEREYLEICLNCE